MSYVMEMMLDISVRLYCSTALMLWVGSAQSKAAGVRMRDSGIAIGGRKRLRWCREKKQGRRQFDLTAGWGE